MTTSWQRILLSATALLFAEDSLRAWTQFDFTETNAAKGWTAHDVGALRTTASGLILNITAGDPWIVSPPAGSASTNLLCLTARLHSDAGGWAQLFYFDKAASEANSLRFLVATDTWTDVCVPLPPLGEGWRLRFDPPGTNGQCVLACLRLEEAGTHGVTRITAKPTQLSVTLEGLTGAVDVVELEPHETFPEPGRTPVVHKTRISSKVTFNVARFATNNGAVRDRIYSGFVALQEHPRLGKVPVGNIRFVEEFDGISQFDEPFPAAKSKKGLQIQMLDDALALGVQHAALNLNLTGLIDLKRNPSSLKWQMDGETFYFNRSYVETLPVKKLSDAGAVVTLILLTYRSGNPEIDRLMLHPNHADSMPNQLAAFNTSTREGVRLFKACLEFLADRFSRPDAEHGRVANYIVGNEINAHWQWYNMGRVPREAVISDYVRAVRIANVAVRKFSSSSRVYLSFEHHWTILPEPDSLKSIAGRAFLDEFNRRVKLGGDFDWHVAYHPYPENLFQPRTWLDRSAQPTADTPRITFKNIEQLEAYLRRPEMLYRGEPRRIILSEQGFHSDNTPEGDLAQAAGYCYAWQKIARLDGIDAFILHRHVDHSHEGGLNLGLWRRQPDSVSTPGTPRPIYEVFRKADTPEWEAAFRFALPTIGIKRWDEIAAVP